jgi:DnaJ family protein C protein 1
MVVDSKHVYILDPSGDMHLLDASTATRPKFTNTWFIALVKSLYQKLVARAMSSPKDTESSAEEDGNESSTTASEAPGSGTVTPNGGPGKRKRPTRRR